VRLFVILLGARLQMSNYIEANQLPEGEKVYLKKDFLGWRVVEPPKNWVDWFFGSKRNRFFLLVLLIICIGLYFGILEMIGAYRTIAENPCAYCKPEIYDLSLP